MIFLYHLAWGLLHSLWLITVLAVIYALFSVVVPRRLARVRYCFGYAIVLAMFVLTAISCFYPAVPFPETVKHVAPAPRENIEEISFQYFPDEPTEVENEDAAFLDAVRVRLHELLQKSESETEETASFAEPLFTAQELSEPEFTYQSVKTISETIFSTIHVYLPFTAIAWLCGVVICSGRLCCDWFSLHLLRKNALLLEEGIWHERLEMLARRIGVSRKTCIAASLRIDSPILVGFFKPMILIPMSLLTGFTPSEIDAIVSHELIHIRRHDHWANLVQLIVETLLFYHPLMWWVSRRVRFERESICDDLVVRLAQTDPLIYAKTLVRLEQIRIDFYGEKKMKKVITDNTTALAALSKPLLTRVRRILGTPDANRHRSSWLAGAILLLLFAAVPVFMLVCRFNVDLQAEEKKAEYNTTQVSQHDADAPYGDVVAPESHDFHMSAEEITIKAPQGETVQMTSPSIAPGSAFVRQHEVTVPANSRVAVETTERPKIEALEPHMHGFAPEPPQSGGMMGMNSGGMSGMRGGGMMRVGQVGGLGSMPNPEASQNVARAYSLKKLKDLSGFTKADALDDQAIEKDRTNRTPETSKDLENTRAALNAALEIYTTCEKIFMDSLPETIKTYRIRQGDAIVIIAPQQVHDAIPEKLKQVEEICESLRKLYDENAEEIAPTTLGSGLSFAPPKVESNAPKQQGVLADYRHIGTLDGYNAYVKRENPLVKEGNPSAPHSVLQAGTPWPGMQPPTPQTSSVGNVDWQAYVDVRDRQEELAEKIATEIKEYEKKLEVALKSLESLTPNDQTPPVSPEQATTREQREAMQKLFEQEVERSFVEKEVGRLKAILNAFKERQRNIHEARAAFSEKKPTLQEDAISKTEKLLEKPVKIEAGKYELGDVLKLIREQTGVNIKTGYRGPDASLVKQETTASKLLDQVMQNPHKEMRFAYTIKEDGEALVVPLEEANEMYKVMRLYNVQGKGITAESAAEFSKLYPNSSAVLIDGDVLAVQAPYQTHRQIRRFIDGLPTKNVAEIEAKTRYAAAVNTAMQKTPNQPFAVAPAKQKPMVQEDAISKTEKLLEKPVKIEAGEHDADKVIKLLEEQTGIHVKNRSMNLRGKKTYKEQEMPASALLEQVAQALECIYTIDEDGKIVILQPGTDAQYPVIRLYNVHGKGITQANVESLSELYPFMKCVLTESDVLAVQVPYWTHKKVLRFLENLPSAAPSPRQTPPFQPSTPLSAAKPTVQEDTISKTEKLLEKPVKIEAKDYLFEEIIEQIIKQTGVNITIDRRPTYPLPFKSEEEPGLKLLDKTSSLFGCPYTISEEGKVRVIPHEDKAKYPVTRVYNMHGKGFTSTDISSLSELYPDIKKCVLIGGDALAVQAPYQTHRQILRFIETLPTTQTPVTSSPTFRDTPQKGIPPFQSPIPSLSALPNQPKTAVMRIIPEDAISKTEKLLEQPLVGLETVKTMGEIIDLIQDQTGVYIKIEDGIGLGKEDEFGELIDFKEASASTLFDRILPKDGYAYTILENGDIVLMLQETEKEAKLMRIYDVRGKATSGDDIDTALANLYPESEGFSPVGNDVLAIQTSYQVHRKIRRFIDSLPNK